MCWWNSRLAGQFRLKHCNGGCGAWQHPGLIDAQQLDEAGLLISLEQFGWQIDFNRYTSDSGVALPIRLDARQTDYRVKLAISRWQVVPTSE